MYNKKTLLQAMADMNKAKAPKKPKDIITDPKGQWAHPGEVTRIPSSNITMKGVDYPVLGVANNGQRKMMLPGADYTFPGAEYVDEYPQMQSGGSTIPVIEDAGSFNEDNIWVPDWSKIKEVAKKLGSKTIKTQSGVIIHFDNNWNPKTVDDNPEMKKGGAKKKTKSLSGTNKLFLKHPLFENYKNKVYDPNVDYFQDGGMKTVKSKDGTVTNILEKKDGSKIMQVKTKDGKYYEKELKDWEYDKILLGKSKDISINPQKWGLNDYSDYSSYNSAFRNARESNEDEFTYKGERYNTKLIPKKDSDLYWEGKEFVKDYYKNQPYTRKIDSDLNYYDIQNNYIKNKYKTTWNDAFEKQKKLENKLGSFEKAFSDPEWNKLDDLLIQIANEEDAIRENENADYTNYLNKIKEEEAANQRKQRLNDLDKPSYFSITSQKPKDMSEDGYWDKVKNKTFMRTNTEPGKLNTTYVHELSHKADDIIDVMNTVPKIDLKKLNDSPFSDQMSQETYEYLSDPSEIEARKISALYFLKKHKIPWKSGQINENTVNKLYDYYGDDKLPYDIEQLLQLYSGQQDDLVKYLNSDYTYETKYNFQDGGPKTHKSKDGTVTNRFINEAGDEVVQVKTKDGKYTEKVIPAIQQHKALRDIEKIIKVPFHQETEEEYDKLPADEKLRRFERTVDVNLGYPQKRAAQVAQDVTEPGNDPVDNIRHPFAGRYTAEAAYNARKKNASWAPDWLNKAGAWVDANALGVGHEATTLFKDKRPWGTKLRESAEDIYNNAVGVNVGLSDRSEREKDMTLINKSRYNKIPDGFGEERPFQLTNPKWTDPYDKKQDGGYIEAELTDDEIEEYRKGGYIVEDISVPELTQAQKGGFKPIPLPLDKTRSETTQRVSLPSRQAVLHVKNKPAADKALKKEKKEQQKFKEELWKKYKKLPLSEKISDRVGAFINDPLGMTSRALLGEQAYVPGMAQGLHDYENPEVREKYLKELGYTPGEFDASDVQNLINPGNWVTSITENTRKGNLDEAALEGALMFLPHLPKGTVSRSNIRSGANMLKNDVAKQYNKVATGNSFLTDMGVPAWKIEKPNQSIFGTGKDLRTYIAKNATDREAELYTKFGQGMHNLTPEDWAEFVALTKSGATDFSKVNTPISRIPLYYNSSEQAWDEARKLLNLKRGQIYKTPSNKSIRTWSAGIPEGYSAERIARSKPEQKIRLVIPSRYTKNLGNEFAAMPYHDPKVKFVYNEDGTINLNAASENELMGNIPGGFKVIGKSAEDGMNNLIIKPVNNSNLFSNILGKLNKKIGGVVADLTPEEIQDYIAQGYTIEEVDEPELIEAQKGLISTKEHTDKKGNKTIKVQKEDGTVYTKVIGKDGKVYNRTFDPKKDSWATDQTKNLYSKAQGSGNSDWFWAPAALTAITAAPLVKSAATAVGEGIVAGGDAIANATLNKLGKNSFLRATKSAFNAAPSWLPSGATANNLLTAAGATYGTAEYFDKNSDIRKSYSKVAKDPTLRNIGDAVSETGSNLLNFSGMNVGKNLKNLKNIKNVKLNLPEYKNYYRVEPTSFSKDPTDQLSGRWVGELEDMPFYIKNLKDPNSNVRVLRKKMKVSDWDKISGKNMPDEAKLMSIGTGEYNKYEDAATAGLIPQTVAKRIAKGVPLPSDIEQAASNKNLYNRREGILSDADINKVRTKKKVLPFSSWDRIEFSGDDKKSDAMEYIFSAGDKKNKLNKNILGIPRKYVPFKEGGVVTELSDDEIQDYINQGYVVEEVDEPKMQVGGESDLDSQIEAYKQKLELIKSRRAQNPIQETVVETPVKAAAVPVPSSNSVVQQVVVKQPVVKQSVVKEIVKPKKENPIVKIFEKSKIKQEVKVKTEDTKQKLEKFTKDTLAKIKNQITPTAVPEPNIVNMYKNNYQKHLNSIITDPSKSKNLFNNNQLEKEIMDRQYIDNVRYGRFDKRGDDVMNRTDFKRNVDSEKYLADIAEDNSVIIDIGSALGNNDPKLSGVSVFELASNPKIKQKNVHVIATDIASGVKDFKNHVKNKTAYDIDYAEVPMNFKTPINKILKDKKLSDKENIYLRTANSIDLLMNVEQTKEHLNHIAKSLKGKTVTYLYNNVILYKPKGKTTFQKLGNINNAGFDHDNKSWLINKNRTPYKLTKPPLR